MAAASSARTGSSGPSPARIAATAALLALPLLGLALVIAQPQLDVEWENHPAHFWLVLAAGGLNAVLAYATGVAARRRRDARVFLVSLAFLAAAGFLGLHALATPGVLLAKPSPGFALATPIGLLVAAAFAAASSVRLDDARADRVMRSAPVLQNGLLALMLLWGAVSVASLPPLAGPGAPERASGALVVLAAAGVILYGLTVVRYLGLTRERGSGLLLGMAAAFTLLAEAMVAVAFGRNWHATWWEWHVLMLIAFALVAWTAQRQWHEERFGDLYLDETTAGARDISVLFADLEGFTSFSERHDARAVSEMLNAYFEVAIPPVVERHGGDVDRIIGDALMATWNRRGDQPDHAERAARAALAVQEATAAVAAEHPEWPRFRVGVNTGEALVGLLGTGGGRTHTAVGDTVNLAARLEGKAPVGGVALGPDTVERLSGARTEPLGELTVKGKAEPVAVHRLISLDGELL
jgi:adenylate cyclase